MTKPAVSFPRPPSSVEEALDRLRTDGGRITTSRRELVQFFFALAGGASADELGARFPDMDQATVYRNLASLEAAGIVEHRHFGHGPATYHRAGSVSPQAVCDVCGQRLELPRQEFDELAEHLRTRYRFVIDLGHFAIGGRCSDCQADESSGSFVPQG